MWFSAALSYIATRRHSLQYHQLNEIAYYDLTGIDIAEKIQPRWPNKIVKRDESQ